MKLIGVEPQPSAAPLRQENVSAGTLESPLQLFNQLIRDCQEVIDRNREYLERLISRQPKPDGPDELTSVVHRGDDPDFVRGPEPPSGGISDEFERNDLERSERYRGRER